VQLRYLLVFSQEDILAILRVQVNANSAQTCSLSEREKSGSVFFDLEVEVFWLIGPPVLKHIFYCIWTLHVRTQSFTEEMLFLCRMQ
jgi:hypothetical protein